MCRSVSSLLVGLSGLVIGLGLVGCGDPLVSGTYRGRPLLTLEGAIEMPEGADFLETAVCQSSTWGCYDACDWSTADGCLACDDAWFRCIDAPPEPGETNFRLGIFWATDAGGPVVQQYSLTVSSFPARYNATLYAPPPAGVVQAGDVRGDYALGLLMVYIDYDSDDQYTPGVDPVVGGADGRAILYSPTGIEDTRFGQLGPGYHRMSIVSVCTPSGGDLLAEADSADMVLTLTADPALQRRLLLDPNCDGDFSDFAVCGDPITVERWCNSDAQLLCDLCFDVLFEDDGLGPPDEVIIEE